MQDSYIEVSEAVKMLGRTRQRIHQLIKSKGWRSQKRVISDGREGKPERTFILLDDVEAYLEDRNMS